jgi:hypothetical protein
MQRDGLNNSDGVFFDRGGMATALLSIILLVFARCVWPTDLAKLASHCWDPSSEGICTACDTDCHWLSPRWCNLTHCSFDCFSQVAVKEVWSCVYTSGSSITRGVTRYRQCSYFVVYDSTYVISSCASRRIEHSNVIRSQLKTAVWSPIYMFTLHLNVLL